MREAGDQAVLFRIRDRDEHHRHGRGRLLESPGKLVRANHDDVDILPEQVPCRAQHSLVLANCAAQDEDVILSLDVPEFAKPFLQREQRGWTGIDAAPGRLTRREQTDTPELHCRLSMYGQRQLKAERQNDREPDPPHGHLVEDGWRESSRIAGQAPAPDRRHGGGSLTTPTAISSPSGASQSLRGDQVRPDAGAARFPKAAAAVVVVAALAYCAVLTSVLAAPSLAGLGRDLPRQVVAWNDLAAGRIGWA